MLEKLYKREYDRTKELVQQPDWYLEFGKARKARMLGLGAVQATFSGSITEAADYARRQTLDIFEQLLEEHAIRLGIPGEDELDNHDEGREPISQIVIHHSSRAEGMTLSQLNALHLYNLYIPRYQSKTDPILDSEGRPQPIFSHHFNEAGDQVFYGYHWKVNQDGEAIRLLEDSAIGWHAGDWGVNLRSVGICIDDDLKDKTPTEESLSAVADIIKTNYSNVPSTREAIIGHNEVIPTFCPGNEFLNGWKGDLLNRISAK